MVGGDDDIEVKRFKQVETPNIEHCNNEVCDNSNLTVGVVTRPLGITSKGCIDHIEKEMLNT